MLKNLKLGARTVGGFVIVLVLLAVVAYVGYSGLTGVVDRVEKADDVNRLIKDTLHSRQEEKNFILRGDKEYVDKVQEYVAHLKKQAKETKDKFKDPVNRQQMDNVLAAVGQYENGFASYVDLHAREKAAEEKMVEAAHGLQAMADTIREEQKKELEQVQAESNAHIEDKMVKGDDANRIIKWALESRRQEKNYIIRQEDKYVKEVDSRVKEIISLAKDMKSRFNQAHNKEQTDNIIASAQAYKAAFDEYVGTSAKEDEDKMLQEARGLIAMADTVRAEQKKELAGVQAEANAHIEDKMLKADDANRIIKWALACRQQEKNFIMRGDKKYADAVDKHAEEIITLAKDMKARFNQAKNKEQTDHIITLAQAYKAVFDEVVVIKGEQEEANSAMVAAARATQEVCDTARADQKEKMEAQMATATRTMFGGAIVAILLGLGFAFMISKSISGGIAKVVGNIKQVADDASNGKLDSRADVEAVGVDFKAIPAGFNNTLDAVIGPLNVAAEYVDRISKGDIPESITDEYKGDFNEIKNNLNVCIEAINGLTGEAGMLAEAAIEGKLDTRGDADKFGGDFGKIVKGVNDTLDAVIGPLNVAAEYIDRISKGDIPETITDEYKGDFNEIKNNLNVCIEAINGLTGEAGMLAEAAIEGKLDTRGDADKFGGDFGKIVKGVNDTLDAVIGPLNVAAEYVDRISKGDIPETITDEYKGDFNEIKNNLNVCIEAINGLTGEAGMLAEAAIEGKLDTRGDADKFGGDFGKIVKGVNDTLDAVIGPLNVAAEYIDRISKGDIPETITDEYKGDFNEIKNNLNVCIEAINGLVTEAGMMREAAVEGKLDTRGDVDKFGGDFGKIVQGINDTLDAVIGPLNVAAEYIDRISKGDIPENITDEYKGDFNEIKNNLNVCIDAINGLTGEAGMMREAAVEGKLDTRGDVDKFGGDFGKIVQGINDTLDAVIGPLNVAAEYIDRISKGDIPESITDEYKGDFNEVKNNLNVCIDAINGLTGEMVMLAGAAIEGKLDTRGDVDKFGGDFGKIVQGINDTLDAVIGPLNVAAEYIDRISKGDIPESITDEYKGDFNEVKNNLNQCIEAINGLTGETGMLTEAAIEGKLDTRGDAARFGGDFGKIVQGVNDTLDAIVVPINEAMQVLGRVADRDLTKQVVGDYKGQLGDFKGNINSAVKNLEEALSQAALAADQVGSASGQIAGSSQQLAEGSGEQASSLEETSSSLEEMASMTKQNADSANQANTLMQEANQVIGRANESMGDLTTSMDEISKASEETSKIIKTIDEIAFQTNLLALNAAVEAARAGEAGAGFAVVADEVRNLAMRAADAAKNTSDMIEGTVKKVGGGAEIVSKTNEAFTEVATSASKVGELVGEIAAASQEQTQGIEQVNKAVAEMDKVTQQNAANAEESASASEEMSAQAQELQGMLAEFKLSRQGSGRKQITTAGPKQEVGKVEKVDHVQKKEKDAKPEAVIPMKDDKKAEDADADFKDF